MGVVSERQVFGPIPCRGCLFPLHAINNSQWTGYCAACWRIQTGCIFQTRHDRESHYDDECGRLRLPITWTHGGGLCIHPDMTASMEITLRRLQRERQQAL